MLLTPSVLLKLNKRYGWGLCSEGMIEFMEAYPDGVEVTIENYKKLQRKFGSYIDTVVDQVEFDKATEEIEDKQTGFVDMEFHADKFVEIFNALIEKMNKPKRVAAKKNQ